MRTQLLDALKAGVMQFEGHREYSADDAEVIKLMEDAIAREEGERHDPMQSWIVTVTCEGVVPMEERHPIDQEEDPTGEQVYSIRAADREEAAERALDEFHSTVPIKVLDDFEITTEVTP